MRCKPIRTVFRAALAAGLLATCQNAPLSASWKDYLHPSADACILHDHHWENFNTTSKTAEHFTKSIVKTDVEIRLVADHETEACVAAANLFELKMQVDAVLASLRSKNHKLTEAGAKLFTGYSQSRRLFLSTIENKSLMLVDWIKIPDMLPVTVVESDNGNDFECDWDCSDWRRDSQNSVSVSPPPRDLANIFVYTFGDANSKAPIPVANAWQVGVDPICPEVQVCNPTWHGVGSEPSICCPIERTEEAISTETTVPPALIAIRPPTLEAEFASLEAANDFKVYQYGVGYGLAGLENQCPPELTSSDSNAIDEIGTPQLDETDSSEIKFSSKDFLIMHHDSAYGSIMLPYYGTKAITKPTSGSKSRVSRNFASPIRTVGQFLVDFANQIENQVEQIEFARRENNQR